MVVPYEISEAVERRKIVMEFRQRLRSLRENRRISRRVLSELCGLSPDLIRLYERGEREPTMHSLIAIANYFDVSIDYLVGKSDKKNIHLPIDSEVHIK